MINCLPVGALLAPFGVLGGIRFEKVKSTFPTTFKANGR